ncbi:electron transfer flavoprotein subunit alpha [Balneatrix alpica]|uniref:Electron transfer flavoprotein subunit alpha/FixB family protein n=1 Tax=Balneatrix alpica TaxID=75684 RepID=A0ABV5ZDL6_9GAMM|nr:electron transfer flavoprotein subunit alpha/FixB family protein [Balneatrix alpica]
MSDIPRRDPRAEWIARNRLHPLHASITAAQSPKWLGPNGLWRRNPHGLGFIGPNGIKRIDRSGASQGSGQKAKGQQTQVQLPLHQVQNPQAYIVVVPDLVGGRLSSHDKDVLGLAQQLARRHADTAVLALVFGEHKESGFAEAGVDRLLVAEAPRYQGYAPEQRLALLQGLAASIQVHHWLLPDSVNGGGELGRRLAARLQLPVATQVWQCQEQQITCRGGGGRHDISRPLVPVLLLAEECAEPVSEYRCEALPFDAEVKSASAITRLEDLGQVAVDPSAIPLAEAEFILSAGNGITDWTLFHDTARILGATEGASRVAVDNGHMPRHRQVGATGTWVTARVYIAVGISGAIQHLQGIGQCDKVVAINTDPGCDMIKRADLSVIGESTAILRALHQLAQQPATEEVNDDAA